jgi:hypothetical protein
MRKYLAVLNLALLFASCKNNTTVLKPHTLDQDSVEYSNYIMNLVMNNYKYLIPDYSGESKLLRSDTVYYMVKATHVLRRYYKRDSMNTFQGTREIYDPVLGLDFKIHRWTCGCEVSLPNTIIYLSNRKDFDYGFIFRDENAPKSEDTIKGRLPDGPLRLQVQFTYLLNRLKINYIKDKPKVERFVTDIADSLLGLKKLSLADSVGLEMNAATINKLKGNNPDILFYNSSSKYYKGYWRFDIETYDKDMVFVAAHFTKIADRTTTEN